MDQKLKFALIKLREIEPRDTEVFYAWWGQDLAEAREDERHVNLYYAILYYLGDAKCFEFRVKIGDTTTWWEVGLELNMLFEDFFERESDDQFEIDFADQPSEKFTFLREGKIYRVNVVPEGYKPLACMIGFEELHRDIITLWRDIVEAASRVLLPADHQTLAGYFEGADDSLQSLGQ